MMKRIKLEPPSVSPKSTNADYTHSEGRAIITVGEGIAPSPYFSAQLVQNNMRQKA